MSVSEALSSGDDFDSITGCWGYEVSLNDILNRIVIGIFQVASYLTDPICKSHELYRRVSVVDALNPASTVLSNLARKVFLCVSMIGWVSLAVFVTLPGVALRALGAYLQQQPFIHVQGEFKAKILLAERSFSLLSWNICGAVAGYPISDGGVLPWSFRIDDLIDKIIEKDADVNCLYEVFDIQTALCFCEQLKKKGYKDFYFNMGPRAIGVSSGILIASKYKIKNPEFTPFPQDSLVGRTKNVSKGFFAFDLENSGASFATIISTHLQHSEEPQFPTSEEVEARRIQMQRIADKVNSLRDRCIVVTGDLNLEDEEYQASSWKSRFQKGDRFGTEDRTWGGDEFCANMTGRQASGPLNLDHTMIVTGSARLISTSLLKTGFDSTEFKDGVLSDHAGLFSKIVL